MAAAADTAAAVAEGGPMPRLRPAAPALCRGRWDSASAVPASIMPGSPGRIEADGCVGGVEEGERLEDEAS